jgi:hypothetical protein
MCCGRQRRGAALFPPTGHAPSSGSGIPCPCRDSRRISFPWRTAVTHCRKTSMTVVSCTIACHVTRIRHRRQAGLAEHAGLGAGRCGESVGQRIADSGSPSNRKNGARRRSSRHPPRDHCQMKRGAAAECCTSRRIGYTARGLTTMLRWPRHDASGSRQDGCLRVANEQRRVCRDSGVARTRLADDLLAFRIVTIILPIT